jgi:hypothetical protein
MNSFKQRMLCIMPFVAIFQIIPLIILVFDIGWWEQTSMTSTLFIDWLVAAWLFAVPLEFIFPNSEGIGIILLSIVGIALTNFFYSATLALVVPYFKKRMD